MEERLESFVEFQIKFIEDELLPVKERVIKEVIETKLDIIKRKYLRELRAENVDTKNYETRVNQIEKVLYK